MEPTLLYDHSPVPLSQAVRMVHDKKGVQSTVGAYLTILIQHAY